MESIATGLTSATSTVQSSIIKPRFREEDSMFSTMNMYEDDNIFQQLTSSLKYALPGSNRMLFLNSNYYQSLYYTFLRYILLLWFTIYQYYLWIRLESCEIFATLNALFWTLFTYLPFPEDVSTVGPASIQSASAVQFTSANATLTERVYNSLDQFRMLPTKIGNYLLERALLSSVPRNRLQIRQVTGRLYIPDHIAFIFELNPLVVPQPPEVPVPYLDYEKRIIVPDKNDVANVLAQRAEWASLHHTNKASETFRVIYESAKCISWAACSGVKFVTIFESHGYSWKDMPLILNVIKEEIKNLTLESYQISDTLKLVNLDTGEIIDALENQDGDHHHHVDEVEDDQFAINTGNQTLHNITTITDPVPESVTDNSTLERDSVDVCHTFRINLTVFFMSNKMTNVDKFRALRIREQVLGKLDVSPETLYTGPELVHYPLNPDYTTSYTDPELLFKFCNTTQMPYSLSGYPLLSLSLQTSPVLLSNPRPANFPFFVRGLVTFSGLRRLKARDHTRHADVAERE